MRHSASTMSWYHTWGFVTTRPGSRFGSTPFFLGAGPFSVSFNRAWMAFKGPFSGAFPGDSTGPPWQEPEIASIQTNTRLVAIFYTWLNNIDVFFFSFSCFFFFFFVWNLTTRVEEPTIFKLKNGGNNLVVDQNKYSINDIICVTSIMTSTWSRIFVTHRYRRVEWNEDGLQLNVGRPSQSPMTDNRRHRLQFIAHAFKYCSDICRIIRQITHLSLPVSHGL